ncbi:MAG: UDP-N-acetyl-D-mannosamine dehydrogenase, partial [Thermoplasmata archaeon]|nr:UDP-N-acetyl-D-mannosamine dehydrogenase [Thermoplasmata archaeon]
LAGKKIAVLGIAYKGNIGDYRESPALDIIKLLENRGANCSVYDPHVGSHPNFEMAGLEDAVSNADLIIIATDHNSFREFEPQQIGTLVKSKIIYDARHFIDRKMWESAGWEVSVIGVGK